MSGGPKKVAVKGADVRKDEIAVDVGNGVQTGVFSTSTVGSMAINCVGVNWADTVGVASGTRLTPLTALYPR